MKKYCIFLKQVSFRKQFIKMIDLKNLFQNMGFENVISVLATGNIIFTSNKTKNELYQIIKKTLCDYYVFAIDIFLKDFDEVKSILTNNPFEIKKGFYIQTFVCEDGFEYIIMNEFKKIEKLPQETAVINKNKFYWTFEKSTRMNSTFLKILSRNSLKHDFTLRTIGCIEKVYNKMKNN